MKEHKNSAANSNSDLTVRVVRSPKQRQWFDQPLDLAHDLGSSPSIGHFLRQIVELHGKPVALLILPPKGCSPNLASMAMGAALRALPSLDNQLITADTLHCQCKVARNIVEKGDDYLLQIKGNQPNLEKRAKTKDSTPGTPFLS
jgi:hypothetical protein